MKNLEGESFDTGMQDYVAISKYARFDPLLKRRETWSESTSRVLNMHLSRFAEADLGAFGSQLVAAGTVSQETLNLAGLDDSLVAAIRTAFEGVRRKDVLPSMRSMQFGGDAVLEKHARIYNCCFGYCDRLDFFREAFWLLLCGCGVGYSVQPHHVAKLPLFRHPRKHECERSFVVNDSIEGWADALDFLLCSRVDGYSVRFNFSRIRAEGSPIRTAGGKAPGAAPLRGALVAIDKILAKVSREGRRMKAIEAYDVICHSAKAVLAGGQRRSATICLFGIDDLEMMEAKTGAWWSQNPQRSASNNSAVVIRGTATREQFDRLFKCQSEFGEPGFFFSDSTEYGSNPCCEIGLHPRLLVTSESAAKLRSYGYKGPLVLGTYLSGIQFCNLSTMNGARASSPEAFYSLCRDAAVIGTLQAAYTQFDYLSPVSRLITENEALLGVSIGGMLDRPDVLLRPAVLEQGAEIVKAVNTLIATAIGIEPAARTTCIKPDGTSSLILGCGAGIHPRHSRRYFRRVQANVNDPVYRHFRSANPHMVEKSVYDPYGMTDVITFCVRVPDEALLRDDLTAVQHLGYVNLVQTHWVKTGRQRDLHSPGLNHNVSNTISVSDEEWDSVANYIWLNRESFTGVALLRYSGDKVYRQAPHETVTESDEIRWETILRSYASPDYTALRETSDETKLKENLACAAGTCELV